MRRRLHLPGPLVVRHVYELVVVLEAGVGGQEVLVALDVRQIAQARVSPLVEPRYGRSCPSLLIKVDRGDAKPHQTREERLLEISEVSKGQILDDWRVLVVVSAEHHTLKRHTAVLGFLHCQGYEVLNLRDLRRLFHDHIVVVKTQGRDFPPSHRGVGRSHGNDPSFVREEIICLVPVAT